MKTISRITAFVMLAAAVVFVCFALFHPEMSWPWSNAVTYMIYGVYAVIMVVLFIAPFGNSDGQ